MKEVKIIELRNDERHLEINPKEVKKSLKW